MLDAFDLPFAQRALWVLLLLAVAGGRARHLDRAARAGFLLARGRHRRLPRPGLADGLGLRGRRSARSGAAGVLAAGVWLVTRARRTSSDSATAIVLVGCLALGVILASDVFESGANIETLLFGSRCSWSTAATSRWPRRPRRSRSVLTVALGPRWLARGFDPDHARRWARAAARSTPRCSAPSRSPRRGAVAGRRAARHRAAGRPRRHDAPVVPPPAAVADRDGRADRGRGRGRHLARRSRPNAPPGATIAVLAGGVFVLSALARARAARAPARRPRPPRSLVLWPAAASATARRAATARASSPRRRSWPTSPARSAATASSVTQLLQPNTDPHDYEPRPSDVKAVADASVGADQRPRASTTGSATSSTAPAATREVVDLSEASRSSAGEGEDTTRTGSTTRATRAPRSSASATSWPKPTRTAPPTTANARGATCAELDALDAGHRGAASARSRAISASSSPTTTRSATSPTATASRSSARSSRARRPRRSRRPATPPSSRALIEREDVKAIFPEESLNPRLAEALADQTGVDRRAPPVRRHARARADSRGATYLGMERANADAMVRGFTGGERGCAIGGSHDPRAPSDLSAGYNGRPAIEHVTIDVGAGERIALLGPNGGGKTTLFRALLGELAPMSGRDRPGRPRGRGAADRPLAAGLPGVGARRRADGHAAPGCRGGAGPGARDRAGRARRARPRRPGRPRARHVRRAVRRPAPARADRPRAGAGRAPAAARRAVLRPRQRERRPADRAAARAGRDSAPRSSSPPTTSSRRAATTACCA